MEQNLKQLVAKYKQELEDIKNSLNYNELSKIQTVSVLSNVVMDLELILNSCEQIKKDTKWRKNYF